MKWQISRRVETKIEETLENSELQSYDEIMRIRWK